MEDIIIFVLAILFVILFMVAITYDGKDYWED